MRDRVSYEWDAEELDEHGDVYDHDFETQLAPLLKRNTLGPTVHLVLVASWGNEDDGVTDRSWAYVQTSRALPETFDNGHRIPRRFHRELKRVVEHGPW